MKVIRFLLRLLVVVILILLLAASVVTAMMGETKLLGLLFFVSGVLSTLEFVGILKLSTRESRSQLLLAAVGCPLIGIYFMTR